MPWSVWALTLAGLAVLVALDFVTISRRPHDVVFREAALMSAFYVGVACAFGLSLFLWAGPQEGSEYFAAYLVEKSLSVDNLFVFMVILSAFAVPAELHQRVLLFGIVLALALRGIFIAVGAAALAAFSFTFVLFGVLLLWTAVQLFRHRDEDPDPLDSRIMRGITKRFPVGGDYSSTRLLARTEGRVGPTPYLLVLLAIGIADVMFAIDSIPASFGVTQNAYLVFTANAFALLGLRALYFLIKGLLDRLIYLSTGLAVILGFIGVKMVLLYLHSVWPRIPEISTVTSLAVIAGILVVVTIASIVKARRDPTARAHAGRLTDPPEAEPEP